MPNNDIQLSVSYDDGISSKDWKEMLGQVTQDLQGKDCRHHRYLVYNKQGVLEVVQSSRLKRGMRKLSLNEINQISEAILQRPEEDISLQKELPRSYSVLLQARVNKWNRLPNRLGRMVALVFLALSTVTLIGIPFYYLFSRWEKIKRAEMKGLQDRIEVIQLLSQFKVNENWTKEDLKNLELYYKTVVDPNSLNLNLLNSENTIIDMIINRIIIPDLKDSLLSSKLSDIIDEKEDKQKVNTSFFTDVKRNQNFIRKDLKQNIVDGKPVLFDIGHIFKKIDCLNTNKDHEMTEVVQQIREEVLSAISILKTIVVPNQDPETNLEQPFIEQERPLIKNLREETDIEKIKTLLKSDGLTDLLRRERVLQGRNFIKRLLIEEKDKRWEFVLQSLVNQNNLNPMSILPHQLMSQYDLYGTRLACFFVEELPHVELEIVRHQNNEIARVNIKIQGHFVNQDISKKGTKELITQRAIQATLSYGITLEESQENVSKQTLTPHLNDFSLTYNEVNLPT